MSDSLDKLPPPIKITALEKRENILALNKTKVTIVLEQPFFARLLFELAVIEDDSQPTGYTDGKVLAYNNSFMFQLPQRMRVFFFAHEILHVALMHQFRRGGRDPRVWNAACDFVINLMLEKFNFAVPGFALLDLKYEDMTEDAVYNLLVKESDSSGGEGAGEGAGGDSRGGDDPSDGKGALKRIFEPFGEVRDFQGSKDEIRQAVEETKIAVSQAVNQAKAAGNIPGALKSLIEGVHASKVDWRDLLRDYVSAKAADDYSWRVPNRRYASSEIIFPGMFSQKLGEVIVAVDTSGSMSQPELEQIASEITQILEDYNGVSVKVIYCDTAVSKDKVETFEYEDFPIKLNAYGGGGTRFSPLFEFVEELDEQPICLLYMTDLCCSDFPDTPPEYPVIWCKTASGYSGSDTVPFGEIIEIEVQWS